MLLYEWYTAFDSFCQVISHTMIYDD